MSTPPTFAHAVVGVTLWRIAQTVVISPSHDNHLLAESALHEQVQDASAYIASGTQQHCRVLDLGRQHQG
jgi:hypothetical protein